MGDKSLLEICETKLCATSDEVIMCTEKNMRALYLENKNI